MSSALGTLLGTSLGEPQSLSSSRVHVNTRSPMSDQIAYSRARACPEGGTIDVSGSIDDPSGNLHLVTVDTLEACAIKDFHGSVWTFNSEPVITTTLDVSGFGESSLTLVQSDSGKVRFSSGALSGTCSIKVAIGDQILIGSPTADSATVTLHTTGTVCGRPVVRDTVITAPWPSQSEGVVRAL